MIGVLVFVVIFGVVVFLLFPAQPQRPSAILADTVGQYDSCDACGKVGRQFEFIPGGYSTWSPRPFPVQYCSGCAVDVCPHLHRTCPRCGRMVPRPLVNVEVAS